MAFYAHIFVTLEILESWKKNKDKSAMNTETYIFKGLKYNFGKLSDYKIIVL